MKIQPKQIVLYTDSDFTIATDLLIPSAKATKDYVDTKIDDVYNTSEFHTTLVAGQSTYNITHNLNNYYLVADVWLEGTSGYPTEKVYPQIVVVDENNITVNFSSTTTNNTILVLIAKYVSGDSDIKPISGDIEIIDSTKGLILRSPNNTRFRITISNNGSIITTEL